MIITVTKEINEGLKPIVIYYPKSNKREPAIYDTVNECVLNCNKDDLSVYHPLGGNDAVRQIINGSQGQNGGFVIGAKIRGFNCWHCHGNVYRLGKSPDLERLLFEVKINGLYDGWSVCMGWLFALCDWMIDNSIDIPEEWEHYQGLGGSDTSSPEYEALSDIVPEEKTVLKLGSILWRYRAMLIAANKDH